MQSIPAPVPRHRRLLYTLLALATLAAAAPLRTADDPPYKNADLPFKDRVADLVGRLTLQEKAGQVQMNAPSISRQDTNAPGVHIDIPGCCWWSEGIHGVSRADPATIFPQALGQAATWDPVLVHSIADAIADEARAMYRPSVRYYGIQIWAPTINMARDPRWGRCQETYGEDPFLTSRLGVAFVKGLQGDDPKYLKTVATPKHFAVHSQETGRFNTAFEVSERDLREYYLPAFYACFTEGKAASTMSAHSGVNGVPCMANHLLLTDILRDQWGFDGAVVTDWNSLGYLVKNFKYASDNDHGVADAIKAGVDVLCNDIDQRGSVVNAVNQGLMTEKDLDLAVTHNLSVRMRLGFFDQPIMDKFARPKSDIGSKEHVNIALQTARESVVLLQNEPAKPGYGFDRLLPLDLRKVHSIAVIGPFADSFNFGDYTPKPVNPPISPLDGLKAAVGPRVKIVTADFGDVDETVAVAQASDVVVMVMGHSEGEATEGVDLQNILLPRQNVLAKVVAANPNVILVLEGCNSMGLDWVKQNVPAALMVWFPGEQGGTALADVLLGKYNPSGRLPITFYKALEDLPPLNDYAVEKGRTYMYCEKPVCFPFGHGLSYTTFAYSNLKITPAPDAAAEKMLTVTLDVANTGKLDGAEVVQLYVHKDNGNIKRPIKQLKGFQRVDIAAGKSSSVKITVPYKELEYWDDQTHQFALEKGTYNLMVGASSADIRSKDSFTLK